MPSRPSPSRSKEAVTSMVYLYLNDEGWVRFGPFRCLRFRDDTRTIVDQHGIVIARLDGECWTTDVCYEGYLWRDPFVTTSGRHPHPNRG